MGKKGTVLIVLLLLFVIATSFPYVRDSYSAGNGAELSIAMTKAQKVLLITGKAKEVEAQNGSQRVEYIFPEEEKARQAVLKTRNILRITGKL